jgi:hypothetical protein
VVEESALWASVVIVESLSVSRSLLLIDVIVVTVAEAFSVTSLSSTSVHPFQHSPLIGLLELRFKHGTLLEHGENLMLDSCLPSYPDDPMDIGRAKEMDIKATKNIIFLFGD